jgi:hypothetical protein
MIGRRRGQLGGQDTHLGGVGFNGPLPSFKPPRTRSASRCGHSDARFPGTLNNAWQLTQEIAKVRLGLPQGYPQIKSLVLLGSTISEQPENETGNAADRTDETGNDTEIREPTRIIHLLPR